MNDGIIRTCPDEHSSTVNGGLRPGSWLSTAAFVKSSTLDNHVMIAVLGEKGSGKTSFSSLLHHTLAPEIKAFIIVANPLFNRAFFLEQLKALLNIEGEPTLSNFIAQSRDAKSHQMIIIDEAQFLSAVFVEEILGELEERGHDNYFHVCLVSDFSLVSTLNRLEQDIYKGMVHSVELGALSEAETKAYVLQNLSPRQSVEKIVTDDHVKQFYQLTAGHLADINRQMPYFFGSKAVAFSRNEKFFRQMSVAAGVLCVALGANYVWRSQDFQSVLMAFLNKTPSSGSVISASPLYQMAETPQIEPVFTSEIPSYEVAAIRQAILPTPLRRADLVQMDEEDGALDGSLVVMDKVVVAPKIVQQQAKAVVTDQVESNLAVIQPIVVQSRFTIQLLASHNKDELQRFAEIHHLNGKIRLRSTQRQGVIWYVLTLGEFTERQSANEAVNHLPKDIAKFKPWVRAIADLTGAG